MLGLILPTLLIFPFPFDLPDFLVLGILVQMSGNISLAVGHGEMAVLIVIPFLHTLDCRLLHFGSQLLPGIVQFHRVELLALCFQLVIFGKGSFQFSGVFLLLLVQFFQVSFHQRNLFPGLRNILAVRTFHTVQKDRLFGLQFFQQFRQFCNSGGQLVLFRHIPERQFLLLLSKQFVALCGGANIVVDGHTVFVVVAEIFEDTASTANHVQTHQLRVVFVFTQSAEDSLGILG